MRRPVFDGTMQLGIVVRDLEATVRRYEDDYGIGPWQFQQIDLGEEHDYREHGEPAERSNRVAIATVGGVMWELIEPLDEEGIWARFLAEKGEGVHHVAVGRPGLRGGHRAGGTWGRPDAQLYAQRGRHRLPRHPARPRGGPRGVQRHAERRRGSGPYLTARRSFSPAVHPTD